MNTRSTMPNVAQKDVFNSFLVRNATYAGEDEIPCIKTSNILPKKVISFSKAKSSNEYDSWIHFYEDDSKIECLWNNPRRYLPLIQKYKGVITPDYSLYYDMPLNMQKFNTYRGKAIGHWLFENGCEVIPNVRWGDNRTFETACFGVEPNKTIAIGTHGCIKSLEYRQKFISGFDYIVNQLKPQNIIVYGRVPDRIFCLARMQGINILSFESEFGLSHKKEVN